MDMDVLTEMVILSVGGSVWLQFIHITVVAIRFCQEMSLLLKNVSHDVHQTAPNRLLQQLRSIYGWICV